MKTIPEQLQNNRDCESVITCLYNIKPADEKYYLLLLDNSPLTATQIANKLDKDKSTVHRSLNRLVNTQLIDRKKKQQDKKGYEYVFIAKNPKEIEKEMKLLLQEWFVQTNNLISTFSEKYS